MHVLLVKRCYIASFFLSLLEKIKDIDEPFQHEAINQILHHYRGYITKRSLRLMKDEYGNQSMVVDEVLRGRMETRLITKILSFEIK